ncbi:glycoside hydrolase family 2 protein [Duganella sp. HH101]|uniref:beta-mannosidase n=1 Tax=Duganella sp. HH101 TaxID=1781066 RepID=UPI000873C838|nr:glycoside hydrolase family 2 protein [Duganella sp. HH101]OFA03588.1 Exo-beta-D-glucosaminidase precursor [Duganella sp. HH101]
MTSIVSLCSHADGVPARDWQFRLPPSDPQAAGRAALTEWHAATVPGHVHTDLLAARLIADPYQEHEEAGLQWIGNAGWEYRLRFDVDAATLAHGRQQLVLDGVDTYADIWLNGVKLRSTANAFRGWRLNVRGLLKASGNVLLVQLQSPIGRMLPAVQAMPHKLQGNYPSPYGDEPRDAMTANFVRKPGYHYGWDWGPRFVTAGIWRPVRLETGDVARLAGLHVQQLEVNAERARLNVQCSLRLDRAAPLKLQLTLLDPDGRQVRSVTRMLALPAGVQREQFTLQVDRPRRWFPNGYGEAALYTLLVQVSDVNGAVLEQRRRVGLRSVELRRARDQWGRQFHFVVNGIPVFAKGANVIPFDMFPNRVSPAAMRAILKSAQAANMNMLRNWGGGYYECEQFYDIADELGLMVWQDFMFGGGVVPAYDARFRSNVLFEALQQVRRLREHACVVLWCGNNEEETAWKDWGIGAKLKAEAPEFAATVWDGYVQLFGTLLRKVVAKHGGGAGYLSSSPSNDLDGPANDSNNGDKHYWDVWAGSKPVEEYQRETPRFMSEFGLQAWPVAATIDSVIAREHQQIDSLQVRAHQKFLAGAGNDRILLYIRANYREPASFADFVYLSQVMQAEGIELASLHHRANMPRTMGSLYWQLNDVWPGASWASVDYYGRWKALQFHTRRFFAPVIVAASRDGGVTRATLVSDSQQTQIGELRIRVMDLHGRCLREEAEQHVMRPVSATRVASYCDDYLLGELSPRRHVAVFDLTVGGQLVSRSVVYFVAARELDFPEPALHAELSEQAGHVYLQLSCKALARAVWVEFEGLDVELSDNALTLLPGERRVLRIGGVGGANIADLRRCMKLRHLGAAA